MNDKSFTEQFSLQIASGIARHGFFVIYVGSGDCVVPGCDCGPEPLPWSYTIGLCEAMHAELVVVGLPPDAAHHVITWAYERAQVGNRLQYDVEYELDHVGVKMVAVPPNWLAADPGRIGMWLQHYDPDQRGIAMPQFAQLVWADANGLFPDDPLCDPRIVEMQPLIASNPIDFPPREPRALRRRAPRRR